MKVKNILDQKGSIIYSISPQETVYEGLKIMAENNLGALLVVSENQLSGIFTERDYARKVILKGKSSKDTHISEVMHENPVTVTEDTDIDSCMNLMTDKYVRHLPVINNDELVGIISIGDVVKAIINEQKYIIENLGSYISG